MQQKKRVSKLVTGPLTFDEATRLIPDLKREASPLPSNNLIQEIRHAQETGDDAAFGAALIRAKRRTRHGMWIPLLDKLGIHPRKAQRLIKRSQKS